MARINFIVPVISPHTYSGGIWCIFEYAHGLVERGHEVSIIPILPSAIPQWFPQKYGTLVTTARSERISGALASSGRLITALVSRTGWKVHLRQTVENLMLVAPQVFPQEVQFGLAEAYLPTIAPLADINVATSFTTIRPAALLTGRKFYLGQHFEPYFAQESDKHGYALAVAKQSYQLGFEMIANSTWLKAELFSEAGLEQVHLCPNAIDHHTFHDAPRRSSESTKVVLISYGGRDAVWKGFREMAEAVAIARSKTPDVDIEWRVYGSALLPPDNSIAPFKALGFLPPKALSEAYRDADILLSASWYESFPLFPIEAMASGLAVITTQPGTEEYAIHGRTAEVVQPRSVESIAAAILKLVGDPEYRYRLASEGNCISKQFTWNRSVERFESILLGTE